MIGPQDKTAFLLYVKYPLENEKINLLAADLGYKFSEELFWLLLKNNWNSLSEFIDNHKANVYTYWETVEGTDLKEIQRKIKTWNLSYRPIFLNNLSGSFLNVFEQIANKIFVKDKKFIMIHSSVSYLSSDIIKLFYNEQNDHVIDDYKNPYFLIVSYKDFQKKENIEKFIRSLNSNKKNNPLVIKNAKDLLKFILFLEKEKSFAARKVSNDLSLLFKKYSNL
ncbi:MAG: hypothetical protein OEZ22_03455 [Spirochaetia bacterium]|nr:hypothetical protein [Spirochaetia bacterium]